MVYKKVLIIALVVLTALLLLYYLNINMIRNENKKVQDDLQAKISNLQQQLQAKIQNEKIAAQNNAALQGSSNLILTEVKVQSNEQYTEGLSKGTIYGNFNVIARVKNTSDTDIYNIKVASLFVKSNSRYAKDIGVDSKAQGIDKLAPNEEKEVTFTGYHVVHPETYQEINVSILHPSVEGKSESLIVKRMRINAAFPPGSND